MVEGIFENRKKIVRVGAHTYPIHNDVRTIQHLPHKMKVTGQYIDKKYGDAVKKARREFLIDSIFTKEISRRA